MKLDTNDLLNRLEKIKHPKNKALAYDCLPSHIFNELRIPDSNSRQILQVLLEDLITAKTLHPAMIGRLIQLNKSLGQQKIDNIRPITAISPLRRALEL